MLFQDRAERFSNNIVQLYQLPNITEAEVSEEQGKEVKNDTGWDFTDVNQVHEFFKAQMVHDKVINKHTGEIIEFPGSTATMDTVTFSTYCEKLRDYASEYLNMSIPDPDPNWRANETLIKPNGIGTDKADTNTD